MPRDETVDFTEAKKLIEDIGKTVHDQRQELDALGEADAETKAKVDKMDGHLTKLLKLKSEIEVKLTNQQERIEELESRRNQPGATAINKLEDEQKAAFRKWVKSQGRDLQAEQTLRDLEIKIYAERFSEQKDITIGTPAAGGVAVPEVIAREIERQERLFSPVRDLVKVVTVGTSDYKELVNIRGTTGGWVGETDARAATATSQFRERAPTHGEIYAYPQVSNWALEDIPFNVESWLAEEVAETFAIEEATAVISGNGTNKPTGLLNTAPTSQADTFPPTRNENAFQFVAALGSPPTIEPEVLFDCVYALNARYRSQATWVMNSLTHGVIRKLKDTQGQFYWQPGLQLGQPDRLLGYGMSTWEQMPDPNDNNFAIGFGAWRRAYFLVDRFSGLRITRDEFTNPGYTRFYTRRRVGGHVLNNNAAKFISF